MSYLISHLLRSRQSRLFSNVLPSPLISWCRGTLTSISVHFWCHKDLFAQNLSLCLFSCPKWKITDPCSPIYSNECLTRLPYTFSLYGHLQTAPLFRRLVLAIHCVGQVPPPIPCHLPKFSFLVVANCEHFDPSDSSLLTVLAPLFNSFENPQYQPGWLNERVEGLKETILEREGESDPMRRLSALSQPLDDLLHHIGNLNEGNARFSTL